MKIRSILIHLAVRLEQFRKSERGMTLPLLALSLIAITGMTGLAIDTARVQMVQSKLQFSLDAAALAASSTISTTSLTSEVTKYLNANFNGYMQSTLSGVSATANSDNSVITVSATAKVSTTFMAVVGVNNVSLTASSQISRSFPNLEVAIVVDVSPGDSPDKYVSGINNFINALYTAAGSSTTQIHIGIVPFSGEVNIGTQNASWLDPTYTASLLTKYPVGWGPAGATGASWGGCVDARSAAEDIIDDPPVSGNTATLFKQYYYPSDTVFNDTSAWSLANKMQTSTSNANTTISKYSNWASVNATQQNQNNVAYGNWGINLWTAYTNVPYPSGAKSQYYISPLSSLQGPNFTCPEAITPLTNNQSTLTTAVSNLYVQGTWIPDQGMLWAWNLLSPRWKGLWGDPNLPLDYNSVGDIKAVVWVEGFIYGSINTDLNNYVRSAYGYLAENQVGTTDEGTAQSIIDQRTIQICNAMKAKGIYIYVVGYSPNGSASGLPYPEFATCPTAPNYGFFFGPGDWTGWDNGLLAVSDALVNLRVSK